MRNPFLLAKRKEKPTRQVPTSRRLVPASTKTAGVQTNVTPEKAPLYIRARLLSAKALKSLAAETPQD